MTERERDMLHTLKRARLMLYAWKGARQDAGYGAHPELDQQIAEIEAILSRCAEG